MAKKNYSVGPKGGRHRHGFKADVSMPNRKTARKVAKGFKDQKVKSSSGCAVLAFLVLFGAPASLVWGASHLFSLL